MLQQCILSIIQAISRYAKYSAMKTEHFCIVHNILPQSSSLPASLSCTNTQPITMNTMTKGISLPVMRYWRYLSMRAAVLLTYCLVFLEGLACPAPKAFGFFIFCHTCMSEDIRPLLRPILAKLPSNY